MDIVDETPSVSSSSSEEIIPSSQPESRPLRKFIKPKSLKSPVAVANKFPKTDLCQIFDLLDGNGNQSKNTANSDDSPSEDVLSVFDKYAKNEPLLEVKVIKDDNKMEVSSIPEPQRSPTKKKITDFFTKINK